MKTNGLKSPVGNITIKEQDKMPKKTEARRLRRMCRGCEKMFTPLGKYSRFCDICIDKRKKESFKRRAKKKI